MNPSIGELQVALRGVSDMLDLASHSELILHQSQVGLRIAQQP